MSDPRVIQTTLAVYSDGTEVWRSPGCNEPFCQRRSPESQTLEVCEWLSFIRDCLETVGGLQEICNRRDGLA